MADNRVRKNFLFNLEDEKQKKAVDFLDKLGRTQAVFVANVICKVLDSYNISDPKELKKKEAVEIARSIKSASELNIISARDNKTPSLTEDEIVRKVLEKLEGLHLKSESEETIIKKEIVRDGPKQKEVEEIEQEYKEESEDDENFANMELLSGLNMFG